MDNYDELTISEATVLQRLLRDQVDVNDSELVMHTIGGADISLNLYSKIIFAGIIVLALPGLTPVAWSVVKSETRFPYVPGYLAFREVPALVAAWEELPFKPDILVVDGHGIAHPRRLGIATHFGIVTGQQTVGCAKKLLTGNFEEPGALRGSHTPLMDRGEQVGFAFRSKNHTKPIFISPGHKMGLQNTLDLTRQSLGKYRIPEPTRMAHELVNKFRRGELGHNVWALGE